MATFDPSAGYVEDWAAHDFVEDASYASPYGVGVDAAAGGLKAKRSDLDSGDYRGVGSQMALTVEAVSITLWAPDSPSLVVRTNGVLSMSDSGDYEIRTVRKSRFGHWELTAEPVRVDDDSNA